MKNLLIAIALLALSFPVVADNHLPPLFDPDAICTHTVEYIIYDEHGKKMDLTRYERLWPLPCVLSVNMKYETLRNLTDNGEAQFKQLTDQP